MPPSQILSFQRSYPLTEFADLLDYLVPVLTRWKLASDRSQSCRHFLQLLQFLRTHFPGAFQHRAPSDYGSSAKLRLPASRLARNLVTSGARRGPSNKRPQRRGQLH
jgi:hypothetical protein